MTESDNVVNIQFKQSLQIIFQNQLITNIQSLKEKIITYDKTAKYKPDIRDFDKEYIASKSGNTKQSDYELDIIKQMNTLMTSAKVSTDRNKEKRLDLMMEMERLKEIQIQEEKEIHSRKLQKEGAKVIIAQIRENTIERLKKKELKQRERMQMLRQIEVIKEEDIKSAEAKRKENAIVMKEALLANIIALLSKQMKKIENKQFDLTLLTHSLEQAMKEEELLKERKRIQEEKEIELQLLRSKQERARDKQAEFDAVRSKRAYEANEKKQREKEEKEKVEIQRKVDELIRENEIQLKHKQILKDKEVEKEKEEYDKMIQIRLKEMEKDKEITRLKKRKEIDNNEEVLNQIQQKKDKEIIRKREIIEEGRLIRLDNDLFFKKMEKIKTDKINELESLNIKSKYLTDLKRFKIEG